MFELRVSPTKPFVLAAIMLAMGAAVSFVLVDFSDPHFRVSTLIVPGIFVLSGIAMGLFGARLASGPILTADARQLRLGIWSRRSFPRDEVQGASFDGCTLSLKLRDGSTQSFTPALAGRDLAHTATRVDSWARSS